MLTLAQRDRIWDLYLYVFERMLPYFMRYDYTNYACWGAVCLVGMTQLAPPVVSEFRDANFVVKWSDGQVNQIDPDQAQEWLNATRKKSWETVGIT